MLLIIDDDIAIRSSLLLLLRRAGYEAEAVASPDEALDFVRLQVPRLILMDMNFSLSIKGEEGLELLQRIKIFCPTTPVILMTAWGSIELAVEGMRLGAFDFITKPWDNRKLLTSIATALELQKEQSLMESSATRSALDSQYHFSNIIGSSEALVEVLRTVARIAKTNASVLITGESGTGKELIAEAIHNNSLRQKEPFVKVNLGGISANLFESEMFGHKKGAFTDAIADRVGRFALADKGTIFLDEIGELEVASQVKLLRVLQDQTFEVLGDSRPRKVDVRVVSATNADLATMVQERTFREDLFYRINLIQIHLPPLRERREDILPLAQYFAARQAQAHHLSLVTFTPEAKQLLEQLPYPGNIRELKNLIERTLLISNSSQIGAQEIETQLPLATSATPQKREVKRGRSLEELEAAHIKEVLQENGGNVSRAAKQLGLSRAALYRRMEKYGL